MTELEMKAEENCKTYLCRECNRIFECDGNVAFCSKARTFCKNRLIELLQEKNAELSNSVTELTNSVFELENKVTELEKQNEELQINVYMNLCEQRKRMHRNLIEAFSEQLGILDKEDDELFSLKAIKSIISNILEIEK